MCGSRNNEMDPERQHLFHPPPSGGLVDAGATPPWPTFYHPESSIRSTLPAPDDTIDPQRLQRRPFITSELCDLQQTARSIMRIHNLINIDPSDEDEVFATPSRHSFTPINASGAFTPVDRHAVQPPKKTPTDNDAFYASSGRDITCELPGFQINMYDTDSTTDKLEIDSNDGRVYHINGKIGETYSGTFENENPDDIGHQAYKAVRDLQEKREKPGRIARSTELLKFVGKLLERGILLILERAPSGVGYAEAVICNRPGCKLVHIAPGAYYLCLGTTLTFCLRCFEMLWDGNCTDGELPYTNIGQLERRDSVLQDTPLETSTEDLGLQLDGAINLGTSKHASQPEAQDEKHQHYVRTPGGRLTPPAPDEMDLDASPSSLCSDGDFRNPPTRFQRIAKIVKSGDTLSEDEKAAVTLWQVDSREQLRWEHHRKKVKLTRDYYAGFSRVDEGLHLESFSIQGDMVEVDEEMLTNITCLRKKDCHGRDLSEVLREMRIKQKAKKEEMENEMAEKRKEKQ